MEKLSGQLKFKVTDHGPRLHKVTGQLFNWPKRVVLTCLSMQVLFVLSFKYYFTEVCWDKIIIGRPKGDFLIFIKGGKSRMKQLEQCFLCGSKEREFL